MEFIFSFEVCIQKATTHSLKLVDFFPCSRIMHTGTGNNDGSVVMERRAEMIETT